MSAWENAVVTNKGIELQGKILASAPLEITKVVAGTDNPNITQLVNLTTITDIKQNLSVQQFGYTESGTAALRVLLSNQNLTSSYVCHLIGIYAKDTDGEEILYAVAHSADGDSIPSITEQPNGYTCEWCFNLAFSNSENISVSIDSATFITIGAADERYASVNHQHTFNDIANLSEKIDDIEDSLSQKAVSGHAHSMLDVIELIETIDELENDISQKANLSHTHTISDITGLQSALDSYKDLASRLATAEEKIATAEEKLATAEEKIASIEEKIENPWLPINAADFVDMKPLDQGTWQDVQVSLYWPNGSWKLSIGETDVKINYNTGSIIGVIKAPYRPAKEVMGTAYIDTTSLSGVTCTCQVKTDGSIVIAPEINATPILRLVSLYVSYDTTE